MRSLIAIVVCLLTANVYAYDFTDNGNGTLLDNETGVTWMANSESCMEWTEAVSFCQNLESGGLSDWRLPTVDELKSVVEPNNSPLQIAYGMDDQWAYHWSEEEHTDTTRAYSYSYYYVSKSAFDKEHGSACRCVHAPAETPEPCFSEEDMYVAYEEGLNGSTCVQEITQKDLDEAFNDGLSFNESTVADKTLSVNVNKFKIETKNNTTTVNMRLISPEFYGVEGETQVTVIITLSDGGVIELGGSVDLSGKGNKNRSVLEQK